MKAAVQTFGPVTRNPRSKPIGCKTSPGPRHSCSRCHWHSQPIAVGLFPEILGISARRMPLVNREANDAKRVRDPGRAETPVLTPTDCRELPHKLYHMRGEVRGEVPESLGFQGFQNARRDQFFARLVPQPSSRPDFTHNYCPLDAVDIVNEIKAPLLVLHGGEDQDPRSGTAWHSTKGRLNQPGWARMPGEERCGCNQGDHPRACSGIRTAQH